MSELWWCHIKAFGLVVLAVAVLFGVVAGGVSLTMWLEDGPPGGARNKVFAVGGVIGRLLRWAVYGMLIVLGLAALWAAIDLIADKICK